MPRVPLIEIAANRIAIIKPSALGDIVHALPVLTALRRCFPTAHLTWVVGSRYEPLLRNHPHLDATLPFDRQRFGRNRKRREDADADDAHDPHGGALED